ncbi:lytic transglycosylase domain-containing protein [Echinicola shivajiensis]|uniref:lytic transglycosylase domain-containing protein n=1 Tax=Echinicola shivajiensis TaxID=1035916 RepID=UPI001BFC7290|nr:lytic transglycosylase domain-containing protein [Echinicola shivajiensis]
MKNYHIYVLYGLVAVLFGLVLYYKNNPQENISFRERTEAHIGPQPSSTGARVKLFDLPEKLDFAGEEVPLKERDIKERLEREIYVNVYWESNMLLMMKRAGKFLPTIEKILAENGVPDDFKYVAMIESGLMNVVSPAGARGFWQFMEGTAKDYGLEVNKEVDERYHFEKATLAACKYIKKSYAKFGQWTNVAASYNIGQAGLSRRINDQHQPDYYDLLLNEETSRYMFRILAFKTIFENPKKYGFELSKDDLYSLPELRTLGIKSNVKDLADWAIKHGSNYKELKTYNPWLRRSQLTVRRGNEYFVQLPVE